MSHLKTTAISTPSANDPEPPEESTLEPDDG